MTARYAIEPLAAAHDRREFRCGADTLDLYLRERASQDTRRRVGNCFVALDPDGTIAGYYTFAATGIPLEDLPSEETRRLPRYPMIPAGLIGRLAVDRRFHGQGLGGALIVDAIARSMRPEPAIFALVADAKDERAVAFYRHHGLQHFLSRPMSLYLPILEAARRLAKPV